MHMITKLFTNVTCELPTKNPNTEHRQINA
jgi:hypothetical protein